VEVETDLDTKAERIATREDFVGFLRAFAEDARRNPDEWENPDLGRFLEALTACTESAEQQHQNLGLGRPEPTWNLLGDLFMCARIHE
jgi:hypothetical protein